MQKSYVLQAFSIFRRQFRANWLTILDYIAQIGGGAFSQIDFATYFQFLGIFDEVLFPKEYLYLKLG